MANWAEQTKHRGGAAVDTISELTAGAGVTADGVTMKDGNLETVGTEQLTQQSGTPVTPAAGKTKLYVKTDGVAYILNPDGIETPIGSGSTVKRVAQGTHGFAVGEAIYHTGSAYAKARADAAATAEVVGMVARVIDAGNFEFVTNGIVEKAAWGLTAGEVYFLSDATAGAITTTEPSTVSYISKPLLVATGTTQGVFVNMRGNTVGGTNLYTTISLNNGATTTLQNVSGASFPAGSAGFIEGFVKIDATTDYVFTFKAEYKKPITGTGYDITYAFGAGDAPAGTVMSITTGGAIQITLPSVTGFSSASATFSMQAAAIGAQLPLQIDSSRITWQEPTMFRNKIINGGFDIWQRGTSQTTSGYGSDDRWQNQHNGSTKTHSLQAFTLGQIDVPGNPKYFSRTVVTSVANAANYAAKFQSIEGVQTFAGETVTLSFWAKADAAKNIAVEFHQLFGSGGSPSSQVTGIGNTTCALTATWKKFTITATLPGISGKTLGSDNNDSLGIGFWFDAGSNFNSRTNSLGQQSGTFDIANVQLEAGTVATPFERRPIGTELALCQRYYWKWVPASEVSGLSYGRLAGAGNDSAVMLIKMPVTMRTTPNSSHNLSNANFVATYPTGSQWAVVVTGICFVNKTGTATISIISNSNDVVSLRIVGADFATAPNTIYIGPNVYIDFSAEL